MIPLSRVHLKRERTPNRKYTENNLYEIHKRLKQNENKAIPSKNGVVKPSKPTENCENGSKSDEKLKILTNGRRSNDFLNLKLAQRHFITNLQRAHKNFQRAQNPDLDSNQNIVDQLKVPKSEEKVDFLPVENAKSSVKMSGNVLSAVGLVPVCKK